VHQPSLSLSPYPPVALGQSSSHKSEISFVSIVLYQRQRSVSLIQTLLAKSSVWQTSTIIEKQKIRYIYCTTTFNGAYINYLTRKPELILEADK